MFSNLYPLVDSSFSSRTPSTKYLLRQQLSLSWKGGCDTGAALAMEGEGKEKPVPTGPLGKERGGGKRSISTRSSFLCLLPTYALHLPIKAGSIQGATELPKYQDSILPDITWWGGQGEASGYSRSLRSSVLIYRRRAKAWLQPQEGAKR